MLQLEHGGLVMVTDPCYLKTADISAIEFEGLRETAIVHGYAVGMRGACVVVRLEGNALQVDTSRLEEGGSSPVGNVHASPPNSRFSEAHMRVSSDMASDSGLMCIIDADWVHGWLNDSERLYDEMLGELGDQNAWSITPRMAVFHTGEPPMTLLIDSATNPTTLRLDVGQTDDEDEESEEEYEDEESEEEYEEDEDADDEAK